MTSIGSSRTRGTSGPLLAAALATLLSLLCAGGAAAAVRARWTTTFNGADNMGDVGNGIAVGRRSVYVTGSTFAFGPDRDVWLRRYTRRHAEAWTDVVDGAQGDDDDGRAVALTPGGGVVVVGSVETPMSTPGPVGYKDIWVRRYARDKTVLWTDTVGDPDAEEYARAVAVAPDGTILVAGVTSSNVADIWVRAYRPGGGVRWTRTADGPAGGYDMATGVAAGPDGSVFVCGIVTTAAGQDIWVRKYSRGGRIRWTRTVNGPAGGGDYAEAIAARGDGSVVVAGSVSVPGEGRNIWVRAYSSRGATLWTRTVNGPAGGDDSARGIAAGRDGSLSVAGFVGTAGQGTDAWVRRYSPGGHPVWTRTYDGASHGDDSGRAIAVAGDGSVYVTGSTSVAGQDDDIWIRKYR